MTTDYQNFETWTCPICWGGAETNPYGNPVEVKKAECTNCNGRGTVAVMHLEGGCRDEQR